MCGLYWDLDGCDEPPSRAGLVVKDRPMGMGVDSRRQELQKRVEAKRRDAITYTRRRHREKKFSYSVVVTLISVTF